MLELTNIKEAELIMNIYFNGFSEAGHNFIKLTGDKVRIQNCQINDNFCMNCQEGLIFISSKKSVIRDSSFTNNFVSNGGTLYINET